MKEEDIKYCYYLHLPKYDFVHDPDKNKIVRMRTIDALDNEESALSLIEVTNYITQKRLYEFHRKALNLLGYIQVARKLYPGLENCLNDIENNFEKEISMIIEQWETHRKRVDSENIS